MDSLPPLDDPGTPEGRVDLLFRERAFWLYLTAHRQGDLRRLARHYSRRVEMVFPWGSYPGGAGVYGTSVVALVPASEQQLNSQYTGCLPGI